MRALVLAALLFGSLAPIRGQTSSTGEKQDKKKDTAPKLVTLVGCVAGDENTPPTVGQLQVVYGPALGTVKDVFSGS